MELDLNTKTVKGTMEELIEFSRLNSKVKPATIVGSRITNTLKPKLYHAPKTGKRGKPKSFADCTAENVFEHIKKAPPIFRIAMIADMYGVNLKNNMKKYRSIDSSVRSLLKQKKLQKVGTGWYKIR